MSVITSVEARCGIVLDEPHEFTFLPAGERCQGVYVQWRTLFSQTLGRDFTFATLVTEGFDSTTVANSVEEAPDWCPKPPDGWDANVRKFRERRDGAGGAVKDTDNAHESAFNAGKRVRNEQLLAKADELEQFAKENADIARKCDVEGRDSGRAWATYHQQRRLAEWLRQVVA